MAGAHFANRRTPQIALSPPSSTSLGQPKPSPSADLARGRSQDSRAGFPRPEETSVLGDPLRDTPRGSAPIGRVRTMRRTGRTDRSIPRIRATDVSAIAAAAPRSIGRSGRRAGNGLLRRLRGAAECGQALERLPARRGHGRSVDRPESPSPGASSQSYRSSPAPPRVDSTRAAARVRSSTSAPRGGCRANAAKERSSAVKGVFRETAGAAGTRIRLPRSPGCAGGASGGCGWP
jgi:hypothetical protein